MQIVRGVAVAFLLLLIANLGVNAAGGKKAEELILGKWKMLFEEKFGKDKNVAFFLTFEFLKEGKGKATFTLGEPINKEETSVGKYRLIDQSTLEIDIAPPGSKESKAEQYKIESLTSDKLTLRAKGKKGVLIFDRVK